MKKVFLKLELSRSRDKGRSYVSLYSEDFNVVGTGKNLAEAFRELATDIAYMRREIVMAKDSKLAQDAIKLKRRVLKLEGKL